MRGSCAFFHGPLNAGLAHRLELGVHGVVGNGTRERGTNPTVASTPSLRLPPSWRRLDADKFARQLPLQGCVVRTQQVLKELGGWETMEMVQRYAHLSADHLTQWVAPLTAMSAPKLAAV